MSYRCHSSSSSHAFVMARRGNSVRSKKSRASVNTVDVSIVHVQSGEEAGRSGQGAVVGGSEEMARKQNGSMNVI